MLSLLSSRSFSGAFFYVNIYVPAIWQLSLPLSPILTNSDAIIVDGIRYQLIYLSDKRKFVVDSLIAACTVP